MTFDLAPQATKSNVALGLYEKWNRSYYRDERIVSPAVYAADAAAWKITSQLMVEKLGAVSSEKIKKPLPGAYPAQSIRAPILAGIEQAKRDYLKEGKAFIRIEDFPTGIPPEIQDKAIIATMVITEFTGRENMQERQQIAADIAASLAIEGKAELQQFACPSITPEWLFDPDSPAKYIDDSASRQLLLNNNPNSQGRRLREILRIFDLFELPVEVMVMMGDDDEQAYLFPDLCPEQIPLTQTPDYCDRLAMQIIDFQQRLDRVPEFAGRVGVRSWTKLDQTSLPTYIPQSAETRLKEQTNNLAQESNQAFTSDEIAEEIRRMQELLQTYYLGIFGQQDLGVIQRVVQKKMAWYSYQGAKLELFFPFAVILMNEQPVALRKRMLRGITGDSLSIATPYTLN